jgi:hypothetical protein
METDVFVTLYYSQNAGNDVPYQVHNSKTVKNGQWGYTPVVTIINVGTPICTMNVG